ETIGALSQSVRDGDFFSYYDLHTEAAFAEERTRWEQRRTGGAGDAKTFRDSFVAMMKHQLAAQPNWAAHLGHLKVLDERIDGDNAVVRVRYGEPKEDEEHDLALVRRGGVWLIRRWD
ncbi:MAG: hypothetical protein ACYST0_06350, partial [Planctomycetota bacterium]